MINPPWKYGGSTSKIRDIYYTKDSKISTLKIKKCHKFLTSIWDSRAVYGNMSKLLTVKTTNNSFFVLFTMVVFSKNIYPLWANFRWQEMLVMGSDFWLTDEWNLLIFEFCLNFLSTNFLSTNFLSTNKFPVPVLISSV